ncbi:hypothetical protein LTR15_002538 [Elasticomyces elasticus]|nr:hypothetical protein LTR15_002538 [Elasticomyces elasticus]
MDVVEARKPAAPPVEGGSPLSKDRLSCLCIGATFLALGDSLARSLSRLDLEASWREYEKHRSVRHSAPRTEARQGENTQEEYELAAKTVGEVPLLSPELWGIGVLLPLSILMGHSNFSVPEKKAAIWNAVRVRKQTLDAFERHVAECIESDVENACVLVDIVWRSKQAGTPMFLPDIDIPIKLSNGGVSYERLNQSSSGDDISGLFSAVNVGATESPADRLSSTPAQNHGGSSAPARKQVGQAAYGNALGSKSKNAKKASPGSEGRGETEKDGGQARSEDKSPQAGAHAADSTHHGIGPGYIRKRGENKNDGEPITRADPKVDEALAKSMDGMGGFGKKPAAEDGADAARDNLGSQSASESSGATSGKHQAEMKEGKILTTFDQKGLQGPETGPTDLQAGMSGEGNGLVPAEIEQEAEDGEVVVRSQPVQLVAEGKQDAMMDGMEEGEIDDVPSKEKTEQDLAMSTVDGDDDAEGERDEVDESEEESEDSGSEREADDSEDDGAEVQDSEEDGSEDGGSEGEDDTSEAGEQDDGADDSEQDDTANDNSDYQSRIDDALKTTELGSIIAATAARNVVGGESGSDTAGNPGADEAAKVVDDNSISHQAGNVANLTVNANMHNAASDVANAGRLIDSDDDSQHGKTATTQVNVEDVEMSDDELTDSPHGVTTANGGAIGGVRIAHDHQQKEDDGVAEVVGAGNAMGNVGVEQDHPQENNSTAGKRQILPLKGRGLPRDTAPPPNNLAPTVPAPQVQHPAIGEAIIQPQQEVAAEPKNNHIEVTPINGVQDHATEPAFNHLEPPTPMDGVHHHAVSSVVFFQPQQNANAETPSPISGDGQGSELAHHPGVAPFRAKLDVYGKMKVKTQNLWWNRGLPMRVVRMCGRRMWVHENERLASSSDLFGEFVFGGPFTAYYDSEKGVIHSIMPDGKLGPVVGPAKFVGEGRWSDDFYGEKRKDFASPPEGSGRWRVFIR